MYLQLDILLIFQTEKHSEIVNKISRLNNRLKEAQEKNARAGESNEDSLDAFMSSLNTCTLSKSDITKMKVELQNLRRDEMKLVKLINLTKPANLPPLVSQVQTEDNKNDNKNDQQKSKLSMRKVSQLEKRRKLFEANVSNSIFCSFVYVKCFIVFFMIKKKQSVFQSKGDFERDSSLYSNNMDNEEEEEEEEKEDEQKEDNFKRTKKEDADVHNNEYKKSTPYKETESNDSIKTDDKSCIMKNDNQETKKQNINVADKKRKKDSKSEKWKNIKKQYDQDVHSEDYSTWVPPQDQSGDGRTNLNDKYGY